MSHSMMRSKRPIQIWKSSCDGSSRPLDHPADYYDFRVAVYFLCIINLMALHAKGPKASVSEYNVSGEDAAGTGSLLAALAEAAWKPDAVGFNSSHLYGTPSYWVQSNLLEKQYPRLYMQKGCATRKLAR
uniref:Uncharacterized protein n=1 Tax=Brassica oleracea var. oleracea TaxID=109376 RepID=A0A0D3AJR4_BRAOL